MVRLYYTKFSPFEPSDFSFLSHYRLSKLKSKGKTPTFEYTIELLLIYALKDIDASFHLPLDIETRENGKPFFKMLPYYFSISHSMDYIMLAISDKNIGVDIEAPVTFERAQMLSKRCCTEKEQALIANDLSGELFTKLWTRKEAYIKYTAKGLSTDLRKLSVLDMIDNNFFYSGKIDDYFFSYYPAVANNNTKIDYVTTNNLLDCIC